jgi:dTDP-glucose pyrophosphorylase
VALKRGKMNLILTMAGKYSRFKDEGYRIPKYLLPWGSKSILAEIIINLNKNNDFKNIYLIANKNDEIYMPHLRSIMKALQIPLENLFLISDTIGQAQTAKIAIHSIKNRFTEIHGIVCFHNIDTILYNRNYTIIPELLKVNDGVIDIFESNNCAYSYVLLEENQVQTIVEKVVISNNATSGFYVFKDSDIFLNYYSYDTVYISDVYQNMICKGLKLQVTKHYLEKDTLVLGTPSEYLMSSYLLDIINCY